MAREYSLGGQVFPSKAAAERWLRRRMQEIGTEPIERGSDVEKFLLSLNPPIDGTGFSHFEICMTREGALGIDIMGHRLPHAEPRAWSAFKAIANLNRDASSIRRDRLLAALRFEVEEQTMRHWKPGHDVHHDGVTFVELAEAWLSTREPHELETVNPHGRNARPYLRDRLVAMDWRRYHAKHAKLVAMDRDTHRHLPRKKNETDD